MMSGCGKVVNLIGSCLRSMSDMNACQSSGMPLVRMCLCWLTARELSNVTLWNYGLAAC